MPKRACCYLCLVLCCVSFHLETVSAEETKQKPAIDQKTNAQIYEAMLYELGAFPVNKLRSKYRDPRHPGRVAFTGPWRIDLQGWLYPEVVRTKGYLNEAEKKRYGIPKAPLSYQRYLSFIDIETYQQTKDPLLYNVIQFTFEELRDRKVKSEQPGDILKVYHPSEEWDFYFQLLLKNEQLSGPEVASLYRQHQVPLLLRCVTPPETGQDEYITFLEDISSDELLEACYRLDAYSQLYQLDKQKYCSDYKQFLIKNHFQPSEWADRCRMNQTLLEIGDQDCVRAIKQSLLNDPSTEVRISIFDYLREHGIVDEYLDTLQLLAEGKGKECSVDGRFVNRPGLAVGETEFSLALKGQLNWAGQQKNLSKAAQEKIQNSLHTLRTGKPAPRIRPEGRENASEGKKPPQEI
ncbi:MAG: hypothetical protein KDA77_06855 [Planctomycetaceae bacterium]|nr:hypothetical protein [Planctomycetaceae bacterium]